MAIAILIGRRLDRSGAPVRCLACGERMERCLSVAGSLRCHDCRDANLPLDPKLCRGWQAAGARF